MNTPFHSALDGKLHPITFTDYHPGDQVEVEGTFATGFTKSARVLQLDRIERRLHLEFAKNDRSWVDMKTVRPKDHRLHTLLFQFNEGIEAAQEIQRLYPNNVQWGASSTPFKHEDKGFLISMPRAIFGQINIDNSGRTIDIHDDGSLKIGCITYPLEVTQKAQRSIYRLLQGYNSSETIGEFTFEATRYGIRDKAAKKSISWEVAERLHKAFDSVSLFEL